MPLINQPQNETPLVNGYKVFCFHTNEGKKFLVLDAIVPDVEMKKVFLQGFVLHGSSYPFPLFFPKDFPEENLIEEGLEDGSSYVKSIENWVGEKTEILLNDLSLELGFLHFVKEFCKSTRLSEDVNKLLINRGLI